MGRIGPFIIESVLGRGSYGTVYRGRHHESGRVVAVKAVGPLTEPARRALRREIEELSRFAHPGVVRIREHDTDANPPYYAMDLVEGSTLTAWVAANVPNGGLRISEAELLSVARIVGKVASTLAHLHAEGLVHRDVNPENILVQPGGEPILIDFGLAMRFPGVVNREKLPIVLDAAGRLGYMAPEVIRGELVDARADLYSLGCVLYELVAGSAPFVGTARAILDGHLHRAPPSLAEARPGVPAWLDHLTAHLLAKSPGERVAFAADVAEQLLRYAGESPELNGAVWRPLLYRARLVGREPELDWFDEWLDRSAGGRGGAVAVSGESGIGKTRLLMEVSRRATRRGFAVFTGACQPPTGQTVGGGAPGVPLAGLRGALAALADVCHEWGLDESERVLGPRGKVLSAFEPSLASVPGHDAHRAPPPLAPDGTRQRILDALTETWLEVANNGPILVIVEDLQWADDLTLAWIDLVARQAALERSRVLLVASVRDEEADGSFRKLVADGHLPFRQLSAFAADEVLALLREMLGTEAFDPDFGRRLAHAAAGNPLFLTEYLQLALVDGSIRRAAAGPGPASSRAAAPEMPLPRVPQSMRELIGLRLRRLSGSARRLAEVASVLGGNAAEPLLRRVLGEEPIDMAGALSELGDSRLLVTGRDDRAELAFSHDKIREVLYEEIPADRKRQLHRAAGTVLEQQLDERGPRPRLDSRLYSALAQHFLAASDSDKALVHFANAAEAAMSTYSNREATIYLRQLLALPARGGDDRLRRARWLRMLGSAQNALGLIDVSRASFSQALTLLGEPPPQRRLVLACRTVVEVAKCLAVAGARWLAPEAASQVPRRPRVEEALLGHQGIGYLITDPLGVFYHCIRMLTLAQWPTNASALVRGRATMGLAVGLVPWRGGAELFFGGSRAAAQAKRDDESEAWALLVEGYYRIGQGELAAARVVLDRAEDLSVGMGNLRRRNECRALLAEIAILDGDLARAARLSEETVASARALRDGQAQLWGLSNLARISLERNCADEALGSLQLAARFLQKTVPSDRIMIEGLLALAQLELGRGDEAHVHARRVAKLLAVTDSAIYYTIHGCWTAADVLIRRARIEDGGRKLATLALAAVCVHALKRHARRHPVAWPRYWSAEGALREARGLPTARRAFSAAERAAALTGVRAAPAPMAAAGSRVDAQGRSPSR